MVLPFTQKALLLTLTTPCYVPFGIPQLLLRVLDKQWLQTCSYSILLCFLCQHDQNYVHADL